MNSIFSKIFLLTFMLVGLSTECGVTTHNVIAQRALDLYLPSNAEYKSIIEANLAYFQAGVTFPDWGYDCFVDLDSKNLHNASETAHWLPFQREVVKYIREKYSKPWNQEAQRLIAFLFGVVSHSIADSLWHDMAPVSVTRQGFIQAMANSDFNTHGKGYNGYAHKTADDGGEFMAAYEMDLSFILDEWHLPTDTIVTIYKRMGIDVASVIVDICNTELYLEVQSMKDLPLGYGLEIFVKRSPFLFDQYQDWWLGGVNDNAMWSSECWNYTVNWLEGGSMDNHCAVIRNKRHITKKTIIPKIDFSPNLGEKKCKNQNEVFKVEQFTMNEKYASFGESMAIGDFNGDIINDIVSGAPGSNYQRGLVYIVYGGPTQNQILRYEGFPHSKYGSAVQSMDLNMDGYDDLIVGIPGSDAFPDMKYSGQIWVYYGSQKGIIDNPIKYSFDHNYYNFGAFLDRGDINEDGNDDLLIGVPYQGEMWVLLANHSLGKPFKYLSSNDFWGWFGYKMQTFNYKDHNYLLVGEPMYNNETMAIGKISCFNLSLSGELIWDIVGDMENARFGFSFDIQNKYLMISAPTASVNYIQEGEVYLLSLDEIFSGQHHKIGELKKYATYRGSNNYARLGWDLDGNYMTELVYDNQGAVHLLNQDICITSDQKLSRYGNQVISLNNGKILVSTPRDSTGGSVFLLS